MWLTNGASVFLGCKMAYWGKTTDDRFRTSPNTRKRNRQKRLQVQRSRIKELKSLRKSSFSPLQNRDVEGTSIDEEIRRTQTVIAEKRARILKLQKEKEDLATLQQDVDKRNRDLQAQILRTRSMKASKESVALENEQLGEERKATIAAFGKKSKEMADQSEQYRKEAAMEKEHASALEQTANQLKRAFSGVEKGIKRSKEALGNKKSTRHDLQTQQSKLVKETQTLTLQLTDEERALTLHRATISRQEEEIEAQRDKNTGIRLTTGKVSKKSRESSRGSLGDQNGSFDRIAFAEKEKKVNAVINGNNRRNDPYGGGFREQAVKDRYSDMLAPTQRMEEASLAQSAKVSPIATKRNNPAERSEGSRRHKKVSRPGQLDLPKEILTTTPDVNKSRGFDTNNAHFTPPTTPKEFREHISAQGRELLRRCHSWGYDGDIHWKKGKQIGRGGNAKVYLGMNLESKSYIAVKELDMWHFGLPGTESVPKTDPFDSDEATMSGVGKMVEAPKNRTLAQTSRTNSKVKVLKAEITVMKKLAHENIVRYLGTDLREEENGRLQMYILMEYVSGGSLRQIYQNSGPFGMNIIQEYSRQILIGLSYLHEKKIIHRDIKAANILINDQGIVKLADFGCAQVFQGEDSLKGNSNSVMLGSIPWMAPEAIKHISDHIGRKSDIWSFGCTVIEMATGAPPWPDVDNPYAIMYKVAQYEESPPVPDTFDKTGRAFLRHCFQRNTKARWSSEHLLEHEFVQTQ